MILALKSPRVTAQRQEQTSLYGGAAWKTELGRARRHVLQKEAPDYGHRITISCGKWVVIGSGEAVIVDTFLSFFGFFVSLLLFFWPFAMISPS